MFSLFPKMANLRSPSSAASWADTASLEDTDSLADTASLADTDSLLEIAPLADPAPLANPAPLAKSAGLPGPHDSEPSTYDHATLAEEVHGNSVSAPTNSEDVLEDFLHDLPMQTIHFIDEDAGSIFDYANGSEGDDEETTLVKSSMPRPPDANVSMANNEDSEGEHLIRGDGFFPTIVRSDFRRSHKSNQEPGNPHEHKESTGLFQGVAAHISKFPRARHHRHDELDRDFQFPARHDDSECMMTTPLLNENDDLPVNQYEHRSPIERMLDTLKGKCKGIGKLVKHRTEPHKSFLRRQVARLDTFLEHENC
jgi:hypothetical protein